MNKEAIRSFIDNFETLEEKIKHVFEVLQTVDRWYWTTGKGILNFTIERGCVQVTYNDSSMGCWDEGSNSFDAEWLFLSDVELIEVANQLKTEREEDERIKKEEKEKIANEKKEKEDREQYERLKYKFEIAGKEAANRARKEHE